LAVLPPRSVPPMSPKHVHGLRILGTAWPQRLAPWPVTPDGLSTLDMKPMKSALLFARPQRPLSAFMLQEMKSIAVKEPSQVMAAAQSLAAEDVAARRAAMRRAKYAPGPKVLRISGITCEGLPDADKGMGAGTADPYLTFQLSTASGDRCEARTRTLQNAPRNVTFPDVLELPVPDALLRGKCNGTLVVNVWDDDSFDDGWEGVNEDDLMGYNAYPLNCRLRPYKLEGHVDRATFTGIGNLYAFRVSFRYDAVPAPERKVSGEWHAR